MSFLLTTEPWLPCRTREGELTELGIRDAIVRAHELEALHDPSPLVTLALHRLVLAVLHRVYGPRDRATWVQLFQGGRFASEPLNAYLEQWCERFDLVHPVRPFYQVRGLRELGYEPDGLGRLVLERSNYGAAVHVFQHRPEAVSAHETLSFAAAARALVALQAFAPGGLIRKPGEPPSATAAPMNRGAAVLIRGTTLFETLLYNCLVYDPARSLPIAATQRDAPCWEQDAPMRPEATKKPQRRANGWLDRLTWQSRRLELALADDGHGVRGVVYCVGQDLQDDDMPAPEPMFAYAHRGKPPALRALGVSADRAIWRDSYAIIRYGEADGARAPKAVAQLADRQIRSALKDKHPRLSVIGMDGEQAKILFVGEDFLHVPLSVLSDPEKAEVLRDAAQVAENVAFALRRSVQEAVRVMLSAGAREADSKDVGNVTEVLGAERSYWARAGVAFDTFMDRLATAESDALVRFAEAAGSAAQAELERTAKALGTLSRQLQGAVRARASLASQIRQLLKQVRGET